MTGNVARPFRILSLDGGGIRGAFTAGFLAGIEHRLGCQISRHFDLIAGTSTGAIIAAALAIGVPAIRIEEFYRDRGAKIFSRRRRTGWRWWLSPIASPSAALFNIALKRFGLDCDQLLRSKYGADELRVALTEVFEETKLGESQTRLVIPAVDLTRGQTIVFKTPHIPNMVRDRHYTLVDVLLATAAAPTFFPHATMGEGTSFVDGGLWANNPSMVAIAEALRIKELANRDCDLPISQEQIHLLSIGTGRAPYFEKPRADGAGVLYWGHRLLNIAAVAQSQGINFQTQYVLGERAHRVDYDLPNGRWTLDNIEVVQEMVQIGRGEADSRLANLEPVFFRDLAYYPYTPFEDSRGQVAASQSYSSLS